MFGAVSLLVSLATAPAPAPAIPDAARLAVGGRHTCALLSDGTARCWGSNRQGQLGDGTRDGSVVPVAVKGVADAVELVAGGEHTCARLADRSVVCWGTSEHGELGDGTRFTGGDKEWVRRRHEGTLPSRAEAAPVAGLGRADRLFAGNRFTCALVDGAPWCWGQRPGGDEDWPRPKRLAGFGPVDELALGSSYVCARAGGEVSCLAPDPSTWKLAGAPQTIDGITDAVALAGSRDAACVLRGDGRVTCVGRLPYLYERDRDATRDAGWLRPLDIVELTDVVALTHAARGDTVCAVRRGGEVRCWGRGHHGELGHGMYQPWRRPVAVRGLKSPRALAGGFAHTCALTAEQAVVCWGDNEAGQLGWEPDPKLEVPELGPFRRGRDEVAMQLRALVRGSAVPVPALRLAP